MPTAQTSSYPVAVPEESSSLSVNDAVAAVQEQQFINVLMT